jgi:nucleotide-binding universal stress UspA family protein
VLIWVKVAAPGLRILLNQTWSRAVVKRILVPIDGSNHATRAIDFAAAAAKERGGDLYLIHALTDRPLSDDERNLAETEYPAAPAPPPTPDPADRAGGDLQFAAPEVFARSYVSQPGSREAIGRHLLEQGRAQVRQAGANVVDAILESGDPAATITDAARRLGIDQIVMGARGLSNFAGILLGSVSQKVIQHAECPVTIVK